MRKASCGMVVTLVAAGCAGAGAPTVDAVHHARQCPLHQQADAADVRVIGDAVQWERLVRRPAGDLLGRELSWSDERAVVFSLGRQPTLGVRLQLVSRQLAVRESVAELRVRVTQPGPDEMAAMALSWPCVIAAVPRAGWTQVRVLDESGRVLAASVATPP